MSQDNLKCSKCNSNNIHVDKQGFSVGKAALGCVLLGPLGLVGGVIGGQKIIFTCLNCGYKWQLQQKIENTSYKSFWQVDKPTLTLLIIATIFAVCLVSAIAWEIIPLY
jgi:tellurium resistance protein TerD